MASSSTVAQIAQDSELREVVRTPVAQSPLLTPSRVNYSVLRASKSTQNSTFTDKTLTSIASLTQLLPTGTALAFQALSPSFTNQGACYVSNKYLTGILLYVCVLSCVLSVFTDSLVGTDGKSYYGIATFNGFFVFNFNGDDEDRSVILPNLQKYRIRFIDYIHAVLSTLVFLAVSFSDVSVQECLFPNPGGNTRELLINLPLGAGFLASMVFLIFPTTRKSIGYTVPTAADS